tara:strand:+ start:57 stop:194 length:138 start_codon:yes stop_codon:yes gene_type:complete
MNNSTNIIDMEVMDDDRADMNDMMMMTIDSDFDNDADYFSIAQEL